METSIYVNSEIAPLRKLLIHSPDSGLGQVVPSKAQDWLFEDIVHLNTLRKGEYDFYIKLLLYFLDPQKIQGKLKQLDEDPTRQFFNPNSQGFHHSDKVIEIQSLLADILQLEGVKGTLLAAICAIERCSYHLQMKLNQMEAKDLAKILLSGSLDDREMIFAPIPNLIFTRDLGAVIDDFILLNKPAKKARFRECLIMRYILFNHPLFVPYQDRILEIPDSAQHFLRPGEDEDQRITLEGGDIMTISPQHVLIGCSERTSLYGAYEAMKLLFKHQIVEKVSIVKIPNKRDFMHIDTLFTQVKRNLWVVLASIAKPEETDLTDPINLLTSPDQPMVEIIQFYRDKEQKPNRFKSLEALLDHISQVDLKSPDKTGFIYSGNQRFPYDSREQWTDSCNLLAIKEGVVLGYDRNDHTIQAFRDRGFQIITAADLLADFEAGRKKPDELQNTLVLLPSAELSRARGGFHCMSFPLLRDPFTSAPHES